VGVAVAGSHGTGKSTLIAAFLERRPEYRYEPEAFEILGDDVDLSSAAGPTPEGLGALLEYTAAAVRAHEHDLFGAASSPRVVELPSLPERQLAELVRLTAARREP
jgi:hypothetical protein